MAQPDSLLSDYRFDQIPFERVVGLGQRTLLERDLFCVSWLLGRFCNYRCSYCWPYARSDQRDHRPTELVLRTIAEIKRQARARGFNSFHFSFSGGEPTLHPGYLEILSTLSADAPQCNYQSVHMTTNLSPGLGWFKRYTAATATLHRVSITASYHREFASRDQFANKLVGLQQEDVQVTINMVMVPERFEELWIDACFFHEQGINVTLKPQSNPTATRVVDGYTADQLQRLQRGLPQRDYTRHRLNSEARASRRPRAAGGSGPIEWVGSKVAPLFQVELSDEEGRRWFMDQAERFNAFNFNQFKGWECSAGYRSIIVREPDGVIKRSYSCNDEPLGHIETGFQLFDRPMPCQTSSCVSSADSKIPKRRPGTSMPLWPGDATAPSDLDDQISVVIPCLNEARTIASTVEATFAVMRSAQLRGEVLVVDNGSRDDSVKLAVLAGARVITALKRGYGAALQEGIARARFDKIVILDADLSYPIENIPRLLQVLDQGHDLVLGNRLQGAIEKGAMPFLNRHLGTPVLSWLIRRLHALPTYDCNSGMRAFRRHKLFALTYTAPGMEFATEMLLGAARLKLRYTETDIPFRKDQRQRPSHLNRWRDGLRHLWLIVRGLGAIQGPVGR